MLEEEENDLPVVRVNVIEAGAPRRREWINCEIGTHLKFSGDSLASYFFAKWEPIVFDALLVAAAVEFCDKVRKRPKFGWGRRIELKLPVHDPDCWRRKDVGEALHDALQFLTGDCWHIEFVKRRKKLSPSQQGLFELPGQGACAAMPFSEGLDSRAVAGLMANELGDGLILVRLGKKTNDRPKKAPFTAIPYNVSRGDFGFPESTARSRGFKFAMLSGLAAYLAKAERIIVPESGQGALGPALVPVGQAYEDYRNHPLFTNRMAAFLIALLGKPLHFEFPRLWNTKGETLKAYVARTQASDWAATRSCWQDNRHASVEGHRRQCGICAACMLRRLSVHAAGLHEDRGTYVWDNLDANTFDSGAAAGLKKVEKVQREYAIAGTLHLDHLAGLRGSAVHAYGVKLNVRNLAKALSISVAETESKMDRLLGQHENEWGAYLNSLGPDSFVKGWTGRVQ
jgi:7-cyano-7-deazaguanine synthase in queuosine biosynthesis